MNNFYNQYGEIFYINTINLEMDHLYHPFLSRLPQNASILDAGCGSGRDAFAFKNMGFKVEAMDASEKMVFLSSHLLEQKVLHRTFQEMDFQDAFEGIWACASLLHVPSTDMPEVWQRLNRALKLEGILYATFKYGQFEGERHDRYFNDYDEVKFARSGWKLYGFEMLEQFTSNDLREGKENEMWLNVILKKTQTNA